MRHLIYQEADHFRKLKIKEWLFSLTDEREDPEEEAAEEETAEVVQKKKRKDKRTTASREKQKKKMTKILSYYRSPSNGASISHTSPWSQPFPE